MLCGEPVGRAFARPIGSVRHSGLIAEPVIGPRFARTHRRCSGMTREEKISCGINLICPVQFHLQKYSSSCLTQITSISPAVPSHRGAFRDRHGRWNGMRWTRQRWAREVMAGRVSRERSLGARTTDVAADGEVVWS